MEKACRQDMNRTGGTSDPPLSFTTTEAQKTLLSRRAEGTSDPPRAFTTRIYMEHGPANRLNDPLAPGLGNRNDIERNLVERTLA